MAKYFFILLFWGATGTPGYVYAQNITHADDEILL